MGGSRENLMTSQASEPAPKSKSSSINQSQTTSRSREVPLTKSSHYEGATKSSNTINLTKTSMGKSLIDAVSTYSSTESDKSDTETYKHFQIRNLDEEREQQEKQV